VAVGADGLVHQEEQDDEGGADGQLHPFYSQHIATPGKLKETVSRDFQLSLFFSHQSNLLGSLIISLKYFLIWLRFCRDIRKYVCRLRAMRHIAESIFVMECIREYESIFETASVCEPRAQGNFCRKKPRLENLKTLPL
jgi:hypothetical protein